MAGQLVCQMALPGMASGVAFSHDGTAVATTCMRFAGGSFAEAFVHVGDARTGAQRFLTSSDDGLTEVVFSPLSDLVAATGGDKLVLLEARSGVKTMDVEVGPLAHRPIFSPQGQFLLCGSAHRTMLFDVMTGQRVWERDHAGPREQLRALAFGPDGTTIAEGLPTVVR
jgi:WD40 repeat protein